MGTNKNFKVKKSRQKVSCNLVGTRKIFNFLWIVAFLIMLLVSGYLLVELFCHTNSFIQTNEKILSFFMILLSALLASTAAINSIETTKILKEKEELTKEQVRKAEELKVQQEEKIYMAYLLRNIEFIVNNYNEKISNIIKQKGSLLSIYPDKVQFVSLSAELENLMKSLEDKKILHVLFYRSESGHNCVSKLFEIKKNIYYTLKTNENFLKNNTSANIELSKLSRVLSQISKDVIALKNDTCK